MGQLWEVTGAHESDGWQALRKDYENEKVEIIHLDPTVWAIIDSDEPPTGYQGLRSAPVRDGVYIDPNGSPLYIADGRVVAGPRPVLERLGDEAVETAERIGDPDRALEVLGRVY